MGKKEFEEFIKSKKEEKTTVDWNKRKEDWLSNIKTLYDEIEGFVEDYKNSNIIQVSYDTITLFEKPIGKYDVEKMILEIKNKIVELIPIGTIIFGSIGRIDMKSDSNIVRFVLTDRHSNNARLTIKILQDGVETGESPEINWVWKIVTDPPQLSFVELNEETFFDALMEVING